MGGSPRYGKKLEETREGFLDLGVTEGSKRALFVAPTALQGGIGGVSAHDVLDIYVRTDTANKRSYLEGCQLWLFDRKVGFGPPWARGLRSWVKRKGVV